MSLLLVSLHVNGQELLKTWQNTDQPDTVRLEALKSHIWNNVMLVDPESAKKLNKELLSFTQEINSQKFIAKAYNTEGAIFQLEGSLDSAYYYYTQSLNIMEQEGNVKGIASAKNNLGNILQNMGLFEEANAYYFESLTLLEQINDEKAMSKALSNISIIFSELEVRDLAISYAEKSLEIQGKLNLDEEKISTLINLATEYSALNQPKKAKSLLDEAYAIAKKIDQPYLIAQVESSLGEYNREQRDHKAALKFHLSAIEYFEKSGLTAYQMREKLNISQVYFLQKNYEYAELYALEALDFAFKENDLIFQKRAMDELYLIYISTKNYEKALNMISISENLDDSLHNQEIQAAVLQQNYSHAYEKQALLDSISYENQTRLKNEQIKTQNAQLESEKYQRYTLFGGLILLGVIAVLFIRSNFRKKRDNLIINTQKKEVEKQRDLAEQQKRELDKQHEQLVEIHTEIRDSINYAKRLQEAILPPLNEVKQHFKNSFILFNPKDSVSGDFYWFEKLSEDHALIAAADCTGHGVPGSMVSVVCSTSLNRSVNEFGLKKPAEILDKTRELVVETFAKSGESVRDGMDIALCSVQSNKLIFCGANNPLWLVRKKTLLSSQELNQKSTVTDDINGLIEIAANRQPVGATENTVPFQAYEVNLQKGDTIYLFSDGFADQFGGQAGKKFKKKPFKKLLLQINDKKMAEQELLLLDSFKKWRGKLEQIDDVCVIGIHF